MFDLNLFCSTHDRLAMNSRLIAVRNRVPGRRTTLTDFAARHRIAR
jgi:hypothetical protein